MNITSNEAHILLNGRPYKKHILLADVNFPCKLTMDRKNNYLFFCINADEFSDQSFQSVVFNLDTGLASIIPGIRNGFASAVNQMTGEVYLGGSDGIFKFNYDTNNIDQLDLVKGIDIFDMFYKDILYFVDTGSQALHYLHKENKYLVRNLKGHLIQYFVLDGNNDLYYLNSSGLFVLPHGSESPILLDQTLVNVRGATTDVNGIPYFVAKDGIYEVSKGSKHISKALPLENGYGLAFNKDNNMVYSQERSIVALIPV